MPKHLPFWKLPLFAPEDGAGGGSFFSPDAGGSPPSGGDGEGTPPAGSGAAGGTKTGEGQGQSEGGNSRPDWLLPKYNSPEDQAKAYSDLYAKFSKKTEDLRAEVKDEAIKEYGKTVGVPDDPAEYAYPDGWKNPDEAVDASLRAWAKENNVGAEAFQKLVQDVWAKTQPDPKAEMEALGKDAETRIGEVNRWITQNIDKAHYGTVERILTTAAGVEFFEALMDAGGERGFAADGGTSQNAVLTRAEIRAMQEDPKWGTDPDYTKKVRAHWAAWAALPEARRK